MSADMSPRAITTRLLCVSESTDLSTGLRLGGKIDMSPLGITRRLREVEQLRRTCLSLGRLRSITDSTR